MSLGTGGPIDEWGSIVRSQTRVLQIIVGALIAGVVAFTGYVIWSGALQRAPQGRLLSLMAVAMATVNVALSAILPAVIERGALANQSVGAGVPSLLGVFQVRTIVAAALLEGAALFSVVAVLLEHHRWVLGVTGVLLALMAMQFPTETRVAQWLETRLMDRDIGRS